MSHKLGQMGRASPITDVFLTIGPDEFNEMCSLDCNDIALLMEGYPQQKNSLEH